MPPKLESLARYVIVTALGDVALVPIAGDSTDPTGSVPPVMYRSCNTISLIEGHERVWKLPPFLLDLMSQ